MALDTRREPPASGQQLVHNALVNTAGGGWLRPASTLAAWRKLNLSDHRRLDRLRCVTQQKRRYSRPRSLCAGPCLAPYSERGSQPRLEGTVRPSWLAGTRRHAAGGQRPLSLCRAWASRQQSTQPQRAHSGETLRPDPRLSVWKNPSASAEAKGSCPSSTASASTS